MQFGNPLSTFTATPAAPGLVQALGNLTSAGGVINTGLVPIPTGIRTLILSLLPTNIIGGISNVQVIGNITGQSYYNQAPYLKGNLSNIFTCVIPVLSIVDTAVTIIITVATGQTITVTVNGDTQLYGEDVFYNGSIQIASSALLAIGNALIASGPFRLLSASLQGTGGGSCNLITNGGNTLFRNAINGSSQISWPNKGLIIPISVTINLTQTVAGATAGDVTFAYP